MENEKKKELRAGLPQETSKPNREEHQWTYIKNTNVDKEFSMKDYNYDFAFILIFKEV